MHRLMYVMTLVAALCAALPRAGASNAPGGAGRHVVENPPYSRLCQTQDLPGTWRLMKFDSRYQFKNPRAPYLLPHQLFHFSKDGGLKSAHSVRPIEEDPHKVFARIPLAITYTLAQHGVVSVKAKGTAETMETWRCVTITQDRNDKDRRSAMKRGDIVMTLVGKHGQTIFMRQLRKDAA
jgi:hypothetical protein